jgi:hypothetical protein
MSNHVPGTRDSSLNYHMQQTDKDSPSDFGRGFQQK